MNQTICDKCGMTASPKYFVLHICVHTDVDWVAERKTLETTNPVPCAEDSQNLALCSVCFNDFHSSVVSARGERGYTTQKLCLGKA